MFESARAKLTAWYLTIIMGISLMFSLVIFGIVSREINRLEERQRNQANRMFMQMMMETPTPKGLGLRPGMRVLIEKNPELLTNAKSRVAGMLLMVNGGILVLAGGLGYWLAGRTLKPIKTAVEEQNRFITDASHELKTPLTSLKAAFEVHLKNSKRTAKESDTIVRESILEVNKLQELSESLLTLSELKNRQEALAMQPVDLARVGREAVRSMAAFARRQNIEIELKGNKTVVAGHKDSLAKLAVILLDNAIKYSPEGSTVKLETGKSGQFGTLVVKDQGMGIGKQDLGRIFDRFYRADKARSGKGANGYGLGLSIAREIANAHRGKLLAKSTPGKGSVFTLEIPLS